MSSPDRAVRGRRSPESGVGDLEPRTGPVMTWAASSLTGQRFCRFGLSLADQGFSVGAMFLVNVVLARTQSKQDYGAFVLSYSIFTFVSGLHNAAVLEPYTIYGAGRYRERFPAYLQLMLRGNLAFGVALSSMLFLACAFLRWSHPAVPLRALLGLALTVGIILTGSFLRRSYYVQQKPGKAAMASLTFFATVAFSVWVVARIHRLDGFSVFPILGIGWMVAGAGWFRQLLRNPAQGRLLDAVPQFWREHWTYARWVLATSFVFQFMHQGYYWLVAGFLSVKEVGDLKAMYLLIAPVEQVTIASSFLVLPVLTGRYAARNFEGFLSLWKLYALCLVGITLLFALAIRLVGARAMHVLYAGKFDGLAPLLFLLALVPLLTALGASFSDAIRAAERPRLVFYAYVGSAIATFGGGIPLVIHWGLRGAVYGMSFSAAVYSCLLALAFWLWVPRQPGRPWLEGYRRGDSFASAERG